MTRIAKHPRLRYLGGGKYEFIKPKHGEADFRVVSDRGCETTSMTEDAARYWAERWTTNSVDLHPDTGRRGAIFRVQTRLVGVTDWRDVERAEGE